MSNPSAPDAPRLRVRVTTAGLPGGLELFTPGGSMCWGRCDFLLNVPDGTECDFWIVFGNAFPRETGRVARANTLFINGEPPAKKVYPRGYYRQFAHLVDMHRKSGHPNIHLSAPCLCWMVGLSWREQRFTLGYDALKKLPPPSKQNRMSVVCSTTAQTRGQRERLKFLRALKERLGDDLDVFGKGFEPVDDKLEASLPYRCQLVLENSQSLHYWTEKLTDAHLGWAFPFYVGCPNLADYFDPASFIALDMDDVGGAVKAIRRFLDTPMTEREHEVIRVAREKILDEYNPFARFAHWAETLHRPGGMETVTLRSEKAFRVVRGWIYRWKQRNFFRPPVS